MVVVVKKWNTVAHMSFVHADSLAINDFVLGGRDDSAVLLHTGTTVQLDRLVESGRHTLDPGSFHQRLEFDDSGNAISSRPSLVRYHYGVHELLRPSVFNFEGLLIFESFLCEAAEDMNGTNRIDFSLREAESKPWADDGCSQLVRD